MLRPTTRHMDGPFDSIGTIFLPVTRNCARTSSLILLYWSA